MQQLIKNGIENKINFEVIKAKLLSLGIEVPADYNAAVKLLKKQQIELEKTILTVKKQEVLIKMGQYIEKKERKNLTNADNALIKLYFLIKKDFKNVKFEHFLKYVNDLKLEDLTVLNILKDIITVTKGLKVFNSSSMEFLSFSILNMIVYERGLLCKKTVVESERDYEKRILENFDKIFPEYIFVKNQAVLEGRERVDILAKEKNTNRDVVIELKINNKNPKRQLFHYARYFKNPILVSLTKEECKNKHNDIIYKTYE